ncbi:MAG: winged helix-turn-helix domain-containing protein [Pseudomonadota bacterium]
MDGSYKATPGAFRLGSVHVDPQRNLLRGVDETIHLEPRIMDVLCVLAEHAGDVVAREMLIEQVWQIEHGGDDSLSRAISVLRKSLRDTGENRPAIETIPKRGYRLRLSVEPIGCQPAAQTILRDNRLDSAQGSLVPHARETTTGTNWPWLRVGVLGCAGLLAALAFLFAMRAQPEMQTVSVEIDRVWLAPVEIASDDPTVERFASNLRAQMSAQLLANGLFTTLAQAGNADGQKFDITTRVDEMDGEDRRVTLNLVDHPSQLLLWSRVFEPTGEESQAFDLTVSTRLAGVLGCMTRWRPDFRETPPETLALYARFCERLYVTKMGDLLTFTQPIYDADPDNPFAASLHAWALVLEAKHQENPEDSEAYFSQSASLIAPILETEPEHPFARFVAGTIAWSKSGGKDLLDVETHMRLASAPQAMPDEFYTLYSNFLRSVGRFSAASDMFYKAASNHPNDPELLAQTGWIFASMGDYGAMEREFAKASEIDPDLWLLHMRRLHAGVFLQDDPSSALDLLEQRQLGDYLAPEIYQRCYTDFLRLKLGELSDVDDLEAACLGVAYHWPMRMYVALGEIDRAWVLIEQSADSTVYDETIIHFYPDMAPFRQDPRFWIMMDRYGLLDYWAETDRWPDFCRTERLPIDCQTMATRAITETD